MTSELDVNAVLDASLAQALEGSSEGIRKFFQAFLAGPIFVPDRIQERELSHQPKYPNDLISILAVQDVDRVIVPVFSSVRSAFSWFGAELRCRSWSGERLLSVIPDGWWITLNPAQEIEKEITPWEITQLRSGSEAIDAIIEELRDSRDNLVQPVELTTIPESEYQELKKALLVAVESDPNIRNIFLLKEKGRDLEGRDLETIIVGADVMHGALQEIENLRAKIKSCAEPHLIGAASLRVMVGMGRDSLALGMFKGTQPLFKRPVSWLNRFLGRKN